MIDDCAGLADGDGVINEGPTVGVQGNKGKIPEEGGVLVAGAVGVA